MTCGFIQRKLAFYSPLAKGAGGDWPTVSQFLADSNMNVFVIGDTLGIPRWFKHHRLNHSRFIQRSDGPNRLTAISLFLISHITNFRFPPIKDVIQGVFRRLLFC